jgi:hypothetical protein
MSSDSTFSISMFDEAASTQVAAKLLKLGGGRLDCMTLMKLMYLVEREALLRWGHPVTHDVYLSTREGPVLSKTLGLLEFPETGAVWSLYVSEPQGVFVDLLQSCPLGALSKVECELVEEVFVKHGDWSSECDLIDREIAFPEWKGELCEDEISYQDILRAGGKSEDEIKVIEDEIEGSRYMSYVLAFAALGKPE